MNCPCCGTKINEQDRFCAACGKNLTTQQGAARYSFGPFGTGVCFGKPSFFVTIEKNITRIEWTDSKISGTATLSNKPRFEIPYDSILDEEIFDYMLWKVLWLRYQEAEKTVEVSIMGTVSNHQNITNIYSMIEAYKKQKTKSP